MVQQKSKAITVILVFITLLYIVGDLFVGLNNDMLRDIQRITHHASEPREIFIEAIVTIVIINAFILATLLILNKTRKLTKIVRIIISFGIIIGLMIVKFIVSSLIDAELHITLCLREVLVGTFFGQAQRTTSLSPRTSSAKTVYLMGPAQGRRKDGDVICNQQIKQAAVSK